MRVNHNKEIKNLLRVHWLCSKEMRLFEMNPILNRAPDRYHESRLSHRWRLHVIERETIEEVCPCVAAQTTMLTVDQVFHMVGSKDASN